MIPAAPSSIACSKVPPLRLIAASTSARGTTCISKVGVPRRSGRSQRRSRDRRGLSLAPSEATGGASGTMARRVSEE
jgi:hypothetical protein